MLIQQVERLIQFEPSKACRKRCDEYIVFGSLWCIVIDMCVHGFENVICAQSKSTYLFGGITQYIEQLGWLLYGDCGGLVYLFTKLAPETEKNEKEKG